jgi:hypothetical protein
MITFEVKIELLETSQGLTFKAVNTYTKGNLYCIFDGKKVMKFPMTNIFRITEDYRKTNPITRENRDA